MHVHSPLRAGANNVVSKTARVTLPVGDRSIKIEWMQVSGTSRLQLLWRTDAVLTWSPPRLIVT